jgi:ribulose kinase
MPSESYYLGIDVGTGSARASLVSADGKVVASSTVETKTWRDPEDHRIFEQSTDNIWASISSAIKTCLSESQIAPSAVKGLGFDATCSLAVSDLDGAPVQVTKGAELGKHGERNIILWADHRAEKEADLINTTKSVVLDYVGGTMSASLLMKINFNYLNNRSL